MQAWRLVEETIGDRAVDLIELETASPSLLQSIRRHGVELRVRRTTSLRSAYVVRSWIWIVSCSIKHQLGVCQGRPQASGLREPLYLVDEQDHHYRLRFDCATCEMEVLY